MALAVATVVALLWANGPADQAYVDFWNLEVGFSVGDLDLNEDLRHWVNDGLMVVFFFVVGLEIEGAGDASSGVAVRRASRRWRRSEGWCCRR